MRVAIIGGGAAGFFAAIHVKENHPKAVVVIYEKSQKLLAKVKISGGGRCNVTNGTQSISELCDGYPRGGKKLKKPFNVFNTKDTWKWFESKGVQLYTQDDKRVFPKSDDSQTVIDCLMKEVKRHDISIEKGTGIEHITKLEKGFELAFAKSASKPRAFDKVIVASGGSPKLSGFDWLAELGHKIEPPVPSLFTFNMPKNPITELMGLVGKDVTAHIQGTKLKSCGPLLITHWGMSGPAILKLSAFGARILSEMNYEFTVQINWAGVESQMDIQNRVHEFINKHPHKKLTNLCPIDLPNRLWEFLIEKAELSPDATYGEIGKKGKNKLIDTLCNDSYPVKGKTTFKEEFVTCGGVSLDDINLQTMESKKAPGIFFCGEVMDIDGITGGYNFQAAWTTGFIAGKLG
jgi:predicted Rossmann fold flavoprotein